MSGPNLYLVYIVWNSEPTESESLIASDIDWILWLGYVKSGESRSWRRNTIQYADGDSEDRPRLFSSYYKGDQDKKKAQRESKKRRQQLSPMLQETDAPKKKRQQHSLISQQKENTRINRGARSDDENNQDRHRDRACLRAGLSRSRRWRSPCCGR